MSEQRRHFYHAEATALSGHIIHPLLQNIYPLAGAKLGENGGYLSQRSEGFRVEEVVSCRSAYTQVAGNVDPKPGRGWSTLATSVIEGLNVLDVVTADRVVAQVSTVHPLEGYVPHVSFLGTRFENLRIAGHPVKLDLDLDLDLLGDKPAGDRPYVGDPKVNERFARCHEAVRKCEDLPAEMSAKYTARAAEADGSVSADGSLATRVEGEYPGKTYGHVIDVPNFGKIYLATVRLVHSDFEKDSPNEQRSPKVTLLELLMIDIKMGCIGSGNIGACGTIVNGSTVP